MRVERCFFALLMLVAFSGCLKKTVTSDSRASKSGAEARSKREFPPNSELAKKRYQKLKSATSDPVIHTLASSESSGAGSAAFQLTLAGVSSSFVASEIKAPFLQIFQQDTAQSFYVTVDYEGRYVAVIYVNPEIGYVIPASDSVAFCFPYKLPGAVVEMPLLDCTTIGVLTDVIATDARYSNGQLMRSGSTIYYESGNTFKSSSGTYYYSQGSTLRSSSGTFYWSNGNTIQSGSTLRYPDASSASTSTNQLRYHGGAAFASSNTFSEYSSGEDLKNGASFYYESRADLKDDGVIRYPDGDFLKDLDGDLFTESGSATTQVIYEDYQPDGSLVVVEANSEKELVSVLPYQSLSGYEVTFMDSASSFGGGGGTSPTPPKLPINMVATAISFDKISVQWAPPFSSGDVASYTLAVSTVPTNLTCTNGVDVGTSLSREIDGLLEGVVYYIGICSKGTNGAHSEEVIQTVETITLPPTDPSNLQGKRRSFNAVELTWVSAGLNTNGFKVAQAAGTTAPADCSGGQDVGLIETYIVPGLSAATTYSFRVCAYNGKGELSAGIVTTSATLTPGSGTGLRGEYYNNETLSGTPIIRNDPEVNFSFQHGSPMPGIGTDHFSIRWTGKIEVPVSGLYTFYTQSSDGTRLYVNDQLVIDDWTVHLVETHSGTINLVTGQQYNFVLEYFDSTQWANIFLRWSSPDVFETIIPTSFLYLPAESAPDPTNLTVSASSTSSLTFSWQSGGGVTAGFLVRSVPGSTPPADCSGGIDVGTNLTHQITGLTANTAYSARVCAYNGENASSPGAVITASTDGVIPPPGNPTNLTGTTISSNELKFDWVSPGGSVTGFLVKWVEGSTAPADCSGGEDVQLATTKTLTGLQPDTPYSIRVCSYNTGATSSGVSASQTTDPAANQIVEITCRTSGWVEYFFGKDCPAGGTIINATVKTVLNGNCAVSSGNWSINGNVIHVNRNCGAVFEVEIPN